MKLALLLFATMVTVISWAQSPDEVSIKKILNDQSAAWNRGDIEGFMQGYWENDSLVFIGKNGVTYGWSKTLSNYKKNYPDTVAMGKLAFTIINARALSPEYFHVIGKWHLHRSVGNLEGYFTLLFKK